MKGKSQQISMKEKIGYSMGDGAANLVFQMMMMFQLFFYTDVFGIKATAAGMILLFARVFDAFVDPLAGILADRTNTKWGKYRPWKAMFVLTLFLFITLAMWGSAMSYYFNYFIDKDALFLFLQGFGLTGDEGKTFGPAGKLLDAFGLIVYKPDQVFAVGFSFFNMVGQLVTLLGVILLSGILANTFGKKIVFIICLGLTSVFTGMIFFVPQDAIGSLFLLNILKSLAYAPTIPLLWAMMADVADFSEWKNHRRATGFVFAGIVFALKAGLGLGGALCGIIIDAFGFVANTIQSDHALLGIRLSTSIIPAVTFAIGVIALVFYPITKKLNEQIQNTLVERRLIK